MKIDLKKYPNYVEFEHQERERREEEDFALKLVEAGVNIESAAAWLGEQRRKRYPKVKGPC